MIEENYVPIYEKELPGPKPDPKPREEEGI